MSSKANKKSGKLVKNSKKKKTWKEKTPLQKGATVSNWGSVILMASTFVLFILKIIGINLSWTAVWIPFIAGVILGFVWFFFVLIMINVFGKR